MGGKRRATSDLNHDNWNQEEEPEDAGTFKRASADELKKRVIKTARRRTLGSEDPDKKSAFANFTPLSKTPAPSSNAFSFLSKLSSNGTDNTDDTEKKLIKKPDIGKDSNENNENKPEQNPVEVVVNTDRNKKNEANESTNLKIDEGEEDFNLSPKQTPKGCTENSEEKFRENEVEVISQSNLVKVTADTNSDTNENSEKKLLSEGKV